MDYNEIIFQGDPEETIKLKAALFDQIAEHYYKCNFGSFAKTDMDLLMFSVYMDRLLDQNVEDENSYSDYQISRYLGITQSRVKSLKERKQLIYPYQNFDWKKSFLRLCGNARYENGKVIINIRDVNVYIELRNAIESDGGYVDTQISSTTLRIALEYFVTLLMDVYEIDDRRGIVAMLKAKLQMDDPDVPEFERKSFAETVTTLTGEVLEDVCYEALGMINPMLKAFAEKPLDALMKKIRSKKRK